MNRFQEEINATLTQLEAVAAAKREEEVSGEAGPPNEPSGAEIVAADGSGGIGKMVEDFSAQLLERSSALRIENDALLQKIAELSTAVQHGGEASSAAWSSVTIKSGELLGDVLAAWVNEADSKTILTFRKDGNGAIYAEHKDVAEECKPAVPTAGASSKPAAPAPGATKVQQPPVAVSVRKSSVLARPSGTVVGSRQSASHTSAATSTAKLAAPAPAPKRSGTPPATIKRAPLAVATKAPVATSAKTPPATRSTTPVPTAAAGRRSVTPPAVTRAPRAKATAPPDTKEAVEKSTHPVIPPLRVPTKSPARQGPLAPRSLHQAPVPGPKRTASSK